MEYMEEFASLFDDQQRLAGEQLQAAWQLHVDRVAETLESGWRQNIARVLDQRFTSLKEEMSTANELYLLTAVEAKVSERMDAEWREALNSTVEERVEERLQQALSEEFQARVESAVASRLDSDVQSLAEAQLEPRVEAEVAKRLEDEVAKRLEDEVAKRLSEELPRLIDEHTAARLADILPAHVEAGVADRLASELPQRLSETLALRLAEEVPARLAEEKANLIAWEKANWDAEFLPKVEQARESARLETAEKTRDAARRELGLQISQSLRMLRASSDISEWKEAFLDAVQPHAALAALFLVTQDRFALEGVRGMAGELETGFALEFHEALAFENALETKDLVVALRSDAEVSPYVMSLRPDAHPSKCFIYPVTTGDTVAALLYVEPGEQPLEVGAVEILTTAAGLTLQALRGTRSVQSSSLVNIATALNPQGDTNVAVLEPIPVMAGGPSSNGTAPAALPERSFNWDQLSQEQREMHMRAQRFARVQVAEMRLYKDDAVKGGRRDGNIYLRLKSEIDEARERYLSQFLDGQSHMRDYLHAELVETLAIDHPQLMGPDYPGPLA
jgi:hypothetical protein